MASIARGESSSASNPVLDIFTAVGNPRVLTDVEELEFRIFDISTDAKKGSPVQVFPDPAGPDLYQVLDPTQDTPLGVRLGTVGHYFAPWTVPLDAAIGDHRIEWRFKKNSLSTLEVYREEFYVKGESLLTVASYCGISDIRREGFDATVASDEIIALRIQLATKYVEKVTQRWFVPLTFDEVNPMLVDGRGGRQLNLEIPIIRLDRAFIDHHSVSAPDFEEVDLDAVRVYNRHIRGNLRPDDRENPRLVFVGERPFFRSTLGPAGGFGSLRHARIWTKGFQNVRLEGVFGYTDPDGSAFGKTPDLIRRATCLLVTRDLRLDSDICEKLNDKQRFRIVMDKEGSTTVRLQDLWLKGGFTGDSEIDNILTMYRTPPRIGIA